MYGYTHCCLCSVYIKIVALQLTPLRRVSVVTVARTAMCSSIIRIFNHIQVIKTKNK